MEEQIDYLYESMIKHLEIDRPYILKYLEENNVL